MLTVAYGEATFDRSNVYRWYKMFSEGQGDVNDEERAGRPSTLTTDENIDEVKKIVLVNASRRRSSFKYTYNIFLIFISFELNSGIFEIHRDSRATKS